MEKVYKGTSIVLSMLFIFVMGCASSGSVSQSNERPNSGEKVGIHYWTLEDFLRRANGVQLHGHGNNISVSIRGPNSIGNPENQPLFVVDGQKLGRNYSNIANMFAPGEIISVEVLPVGSTSLYGMQGNYGVIEIESRNAAQRNSK